MHFIYDINYLHDIHHHYIMHIPATEPMRPPSLLSDGCRLASSTLSFHHHQYLGLGTDEGSAVGRLLLVDTVWGAVDGGAGLFSQEGS